MLSNKYQEIAELDIAGFAEKIRDNRLMYENTNKSIVCHLGNGKVIIPYKDKSESIDFLMSDLENGDVLSLKNFLASKLMSRFAVIAPSEFHYDSFHGLEIEINRCEQLINKDLYVDFTVGTRLIFEEF